MKKESISVNKLKNLEIILNFKISRAWKGYGSALFLELGDLHDELAWKKGNKPTTTSVGEFTLSSAGSWKLIKKVAKTKELNIEQLLDAENATYFEIKEIINKIDSLTIKSIDLNGKLVLSLSNNFILEFNNAEYGYFTLVSNVKPFISYEDNSFYAHHSIL